MTNVIEKLEKAVCRLLCGEDKATAFLISKNQAVTARHAIDDYFTEDEPIYLEFLNLNSKPIIRKATPISFPENEDFCISVLVLEEEIISDIYLEFTEYQIEKDDIYETFGYPVVKWNNGDRTKSNVSRRIDDKMTLFYDWDVDLNHNSNIDDFKGLSGAPLIINEMLVGVVLAESTENGKSISIGAISIERIERILLSVNISINYPPIYYDLDEIHEIDENNDYSDATFITKLESANIYDHEDCQQEFFNADIVKSSIESRKIETEMKKFTMLSHTLKSVWKTEHRLYSDERDGNVLLAKVYGRVEDLSETTLKSDLSLSLIVKKGMLHQLSDECKVGWTKNYKNRLSEFIAEKEQEND